MKTFMKRRIQKIPVRNQHIFLFRLSQLLDEGYSFSLAVQLLLPHFTEDSERIMTMIHLQFSKGEGLQEIFKSCGYKIKDLFSISLAEVHGKLSLALKVTAEKMRKEQDLKKTLMKLLIYPFLLFVFLIGLFILMNLYIFPRFEQLYVTQQLKGSGDFNSLFHTLPSLFMSMGVLIIGLIGILFIAYSILPFRIQRKIVPKLIGLRSIWYEMITVHFAREISFLLQQGLSIQQSLKSLNEQSNQRWVQFVSKNIMEQLLKGESLIHAIKQESLFTAEFYKFVQIGEMNGQLSKELLIFSDFIQMRIEERVDRWVKTIQPLALICIAVGIVVTYMSILIPMYQMMNSI